MSTSTIIKYEKIKNLTHQITYNRLLRATARILRQNVFELNDEYTRNKIKQELKILFNKAKQYAIEDYKITIKDFDSARPHYLEVDIIIKLPAMIHYVLLNINNVEEY